MEQSAILAQNKAKQLGLTMTSSWRSKAKEASLSGGSSNSMHTMGSADNPYAYDFSGSQTAMATLAKWAKDSGMFTEVIYNSPGHYNHVHLGWATGKHETPYYYVNGVKSTGESKIGTNNSADSDTAETSSSSLAVSVLKSMTTVAFVVFFIVLGAAFFIQVFPKVGSVSAKAVKTVKKAATKAVIKGGKK